ncbi:MAG: hypothetical protein AAFR67_15615 [Chloroflexota bacterium]
MNQMNPATYKSLLLSVFNTSEEELALHRAGKISDRQHKVVLEARRRDAMFATRFAVLVAVVCFPLLVMIVTNEQFFQDFGLPQAGILVVMGGVPTLLLGAMV